MMPGGQKKEKGTNPGIILLTRIKGFHPYMNP
jgi:hypothetical protein